MCGIFGVVGESINRSEILTLIRHSRQRGKDSSGLVLVNNKKIQIIDVRGKEEYENGHIPHALNISLLDIKDRINQLDKNVQFVVACGKGGGRSAEGAKLLKDFGLNAIWLCGGTNKWLESN
jgi:rhodanese-related sulfurtransferase